MRVRQARPGSDRAEPRAAGTGGEGARAAATGGGDLIGCRFPWEAERARRPVSARVGELDFGGVGDSLGMMGRGDRREAKRRRRRCDGRGSGVWFATDG